MPDLFEPEFEFLFNFDGEITNVITRFRETYANQIIKWGEMPGSGMGQTETCWVNFHRDYAWKIGLSDYPYRLSIAGKLKTYDDFAEKQHIAFAKSIRDFLEANHCEYEFVAFFSLDQ